MLKYYYYKQKQFKQTGGKISPGTMMEYTINTLLFQSHMSCYSEANA